MSKLSFWAIVVVAANTMNGPGLTTLPSIAHSAGKLPFCGLVVVAACTAAFVLKRLCELIWKQPQFQQPGSNRLHGHHESSTVDLVSLTELIFRRRKLAAGIMVGCALSLALAQMMLCAAIADSILVASLGKSCGMGMFSGHWHCTNYLSMKPFLQPNNPVSLLSFGVMVSSAITVSLASVDLDSMLTAQYILFACLLIACARFCYTLQETAVHQRQHDLLDWNTNQQRTEFWGPSPFDAIGPVLFNFAFVVTAPPLSCGASSCLGAKQALVVSVGIMGALYISVGATGAVAAQNAAGDANLLSLVLRGTSDEQVVGMDIFAVVLFGFSQLAAIPVYCELARETLQTHLQIQSRRTAFLASHVLPWVVVAITYNSALFESFVEWSSLLLLGFANFSLPLLLDHHAGGGKRHTPGAGPDSVLWGLCLVTASIAGVIVQRMTSNLWLAEATFMVTTLLILRYEHD